MGGRNFCFRGVAQNYNGVPPTFLHGALESNKRDGKHIQHLEKVPRQHVEKVTLILSTRAQCIHYTHFTAGPCCANLSKL